MRGSDGERGKEGIFKPHCFFSFRRCVRHQGSLPVVIWSDRVQTAVSTCCYRHDFYRPIKQKIKGNNCQVWSLARKINQMSHASLPLKVTRLIPWQCVKCCEEMERQRWGRKPPKKNKNRVRKRRGTQWTFSCRHQRRRSSWSDLKHAIEITRDIIAFLVAGW